MRPAALVFLAVSLAAQPVSARDAGWWSVSLYSGVTDARPSEVSGRVSDIAGSFLFVTDWSVIPFDETPYLGVRLTRWSDLRNGVALDLTSIALSADDSGSELAALSFADGMVVATVNWMHRVKPRLPKTDSGWEPYVGLGAGVAVPDTEIQTLSGTKRGSQFGGPAIVALAGVARNVSDDLELFVEYKLTHARLELDLGLGGSLETDLTTHAINFGMTLDF